LVASDQDRQFTNSAPYGSAAQITRHFGYKVPLPEYDVQSEKFRVLMPQEEKPNQAWGLLVWISAENNARANEDLIGQLAAHRLLLVSAYQSGNDRHPLDRFRLALDAACNMCRLYHVDTQRIYVGGFSGGSRIASMLGVAYGDLFTGTLCVCGVNFYLNLSGPGGEQYPSTFTPDPGALARAKQVGRFVLVTGENDPNRPSMKTLAQTGFRREGFKHLLYLEVPGMGHAVPGPDSLKQSFDFLQAKP
jgi:predicted esterase